MTYLQKYSLLTLCARNFLCDDHLQVFSCVKKRDQPYFKQNYNFVRCYGFSALHCLEVAVCNESTKMQMSCGTNTPPLEVQVHP